MEKKAYISPTISIVAISRVALLVDSTTFVEYDQNTNTEEALAPPVMMDVFE